VHSTQCDRTHNYLHIAESCSISANTPLIMDPECSLDIIYETAETTLISPHAITLRSSLMQISGQANNNKMLMCIEGTCFSVKFAVCQILAWNSPSLLRAAISLR
jgi:hypothetical protein